MHPTVHWSTICNNQDMEATKMSIKRGIDKEAVVHICNGMLLNYKKNEIMPFEAIWIDLELIILSEVSQTKTNIM